MRVFVLLPARSCRCSGGLFGVWFLPALTFFITIIVAKKATEDHLVAKWEKCVIEKGSAINLSLWDNAIRALEQRTKLSLLNLHCFGMFSVKYVFVSDSFI